MLLHSCPSPTDPAEVSSPAACRALADLGSRVYATRVRRYNVTRAHMVQLCEAIIALGYQFILLDCPAGIDVGFINAISPAKEALIVTTPEITSIRSGTKGLKDVLPVASCAYHPCTQSQGSWCM